MFRFMTVQNILFTLLALCPAFTPGSASAQESINHASVSGRVTDPSGAVIEGAQITSKQIETNSSNTAKTDREGRFRFPYLRVGTYEIKIHKDGFADAIRALVLTVGSAFELPLSLSVESAQSKITVIGEGDVLEAARVEIVCLPEPPRRNADAWDAVLLQ